MATTPALVAGFDDRDGDALGTALEVREHSGYHSSRFTSIADEQLGIEDLI
jgi:hypothetical protein